MTITAAGVHNAEEIERALIEFAKEADGGLIVAPAPPTFGNRQMIADIAVRLHLPAVYSYRFFVTSGGLASYSIDGKDLHLLIALVQLPFAAPHNVRYWHKADITIVLNHVRFWG